MLLVLLLSSCCCRRAATLACPLRFLGTRVTERSPWGRAATCCHESHDSCVRRAGGGRSEFERACRIDSFLGLPWRCSDGRNRVTAGGSFELFAALSSPCFGRNPRGTRASHAGQLRQRRAGSPPFSFRAFLNLG